MPSCPSGKVLWAEPCFPCAFSLQQGWRRGWDLCPQTVSVLSLCSEWVEEPLSTLQPLRDPKVERAQRRRAEGEHRGAQLLAQQTWVRRAARGQGPAGPHLPSLGTPNPQECVPKARPAL